ncbi:MAG: hypothetical protein K2H36_00295, partial [Clostridia bacterium]|nr:hypothetical protein [Clostridia bacterium]
MDIRNRKLGRWFALLAVIIILSLCLAMALPSVSAVAPSDIVQATAVDSRKASVLNINQKGEYNNNFSSAITGGQNEYIYFGTNVTSNTENEPGYNNTHTGAIKWRVLSGNDTKYSNGNMLLWADYQLGSAQYNLYYNNPNFAYYGTSMIRAKLNGGTYYTGSAASENSTLLIDESYLYKIFGEAERIGIVPADSYESKCWGFISSTYATTGIVGTGSGQYDPSNIGNANTPGSYARLDDTSVIEYIPAGDSLFLLDYYDINNADYGFSDNGTTYANKINASWTPSSAGFPGYYDNGNNGKTTSDYLKFSGDITGYYWLRPAGRRSSSEARALDVYSNGYVTGGSVNDYRGMRPAFNLSPENVIYATAASVSSNNSTIASVSSISSSDGKPAYKVYIKTDDYVNYNESTSNRPSILATSSSVTVTKAGQNGNAIFLLADKSGSGAVEYQATASFNNGVATATLPSNVKASDYVITVLFADSIKGENYAESITASYTAYAEVSSPRNVNVEYTGLPLTLADVADSQKSWYDPFSMDLTYLTSSMVNADTYQVKATINDELKAEGVKFSGEPDASKGEDEYTRYFNFTITKKKIGVDIDNPSGGGELIVTPKTGAVYTGDTEANKRAPIFAVSYKNNSTGIVYNSYPTEIGTYTATVSISNDCNYELDGSYTETVTVDARKISKPSVGLTTLPYNGETQDFTVSGVSNDVTITAVTSGLTYSNGKLSAKDFGAYKATVSLADGGKNTEWVGGGTADYE